MFSSRIVCTYLYAITKYGYPPPAGDTLKYIQEMSKLGFRSIELEGVREQHLLEMYELRHEIRRALTEFNLNLPFFCGVLPGLTSPDKATRKHQLRLFEKGCQTAKFLGATGILDNAPLPPYIFPEDIPLVRHYDDNVLAAARFPENLSWEEFWNYLVETYRDACDIAASHGLTYLMHPSIGVLCSNTDGFLFFYDAVKKDNLRFNLDTANQFVMKENLSLALRRLKHFIEYIHLSDNRGFKVEHLGVGDGNIQWEDFLDTLASIGFDGYIGLDIGGAESTIHDLDRAYLSTAAWLEEHWIMRPGQRGS